MKDLTIPIPNFLEEQIAEVEVKINGKKRKYNFRVESFPWIDKAENSQSDAAVSLRIKNLQEQLENYDSNWELIQIFTPRQGAKNIQVLFRQR